MDEEQKNRPSRKRAGKLETSGNAGGRGHVRPRGTKREHKYTAPPLLPEHPWERQPNESDSSFAYFVAYRDLGPGNRSHVRAAAKLGKPRQVMDRLSTAWDWVARCAAYDAWVDRQTKLAEIAEVKEMRRRHVQMAMSLQGAAALALNKIIAAEKAVGADGAPGPLTLKPGEVKELAELGTKLERLTRGEPSEIEQLRADVQARPALDYSRLTTDELRQLREITRKAGAG